MSFVRLFRLAIVLGHLAAPARDSEGYARQRVEERCRIRIIVRWR